MYNQNQTKIKIFMKKFDLKNIDTCPFCGHEIDFTDEITDCSCSFCKESLLGLPIYDNEKINYVKTPRHLTKTITIQIK